MVPWRQQLYQSLTTIQETLCFLYVTTSFSRRFHLLNGISTFSVQYSRNKAAYFASRFHWTVAGAGTADRDLKRLTVSRCETDLGNIKTEYENIYNIALSTAVSVSACHFTLKERLCSIIF